MDLQHFVQRARAIALEIESDIAKAEGLDRRHDPLGHGRVECARQLAGIDLDPRQLAVMPKTQLAEAERAQPLLALLDLAQPLLGDLGPIGQSR
jgi:hypothetical protein